MKRYLYLALVLVGIVALTSAAMAFAPSAASEGYTKNVVFVSDNNAGGDGTGRNADNPLRPVAVDSFFLDEDTSNSVTFGRYYLKAALYQAAERLVDTGGTIVICGPVVLDERNTYGSSATNKDFYLPESDNAIVITSKYNGVDYAASGAHLTLKSCAHLGIGAPTTFENITIKTEGTSRSIAGRGHKLVMGEGIVCEAKDTTNTGHVSVYGGSRHGSISTGTDLTVLSGTYSYVAGATWGSVQTKNGKPALETVNGDVNLKVLGGTVKHSLVGTTLSAHTVLIKGDVNVIVDGGAYIEGEMFAMGKLKSFATAGNEVYVKLGTVTFKNTGSGASRFQAFRGFGNSSSPDTTEATYGPLGETFKAANTTIDLASAKVTSQKSGGANAFYAFVLATKNINNESYVSTSYAFSGYDSALYPTAWLTAVSASRPVLPAVVVGGVYRPTDAKVTATFSDGSTTYTQVVEFDERNTAFTEEIIPNYNSSGKTLIWFRYGGKAYSSLYIEDMGSRYAKAPEVSLLGARLKTEGDRQSLRFVSEYTLSEGVTVKEAGVLAVKSYMLSDESELTLDATFGNVKYVATPELTNEFGGKMRFECDYGEINQREFVQNYTARAYVIYTVGGVDFIAYSDAAVKNPYEMAGRAVKNTVLESAANIEHLSTKLIAVADGYSTAKQYVSDEELDTLRRSVVDYMELMANLEWSPEHSFAMYNNTGDEDIDDVREQTASGNLIQGVGMSGIFEAGKTYYGMPYTSSSTTTMQTSNFESFLTLLDLTYEMDKFTEYKGQAVPYSASDWKNKGSLTWKYAVSNKDSLNFSSWMYYNLNGTEKDAAYLNYTIIPGSHCSKSVFSAWNLVLNNTVATSRLTATYRVVPGSNSNVMAVGGYNYKGITEENNTRQIIESNGVVFNTNSSGAITSINYEASDLSVMYNAYKSVKPGDGLIHYTDSGHTRMVIDVYYNEANPGKSIVKTLECANWTVPHLRMADPQSATSGVNLAVVYDNNSCWKVREYSFDNLLITTYIPSRITELTTGLVDKLSVIVTDTDIAKGELNGTVKSNMQIVSLDVTITGNGFSKNETIYLTSEAMHLAKYDITKLDLVTRFGLTKGQSYNITLKVGTPGYVSGYTDAAKYPNDVDNDDHIATGYTSTFTTVWSNMPFVA